MASPKRHVPLAVAVLAASLLSACGSAPKKTPPPASTGIPGVPTLSTAREGVANLASASGSLVSGQLKVQAVMGGVRLVGAVGGLQRGGTYALQLTQVGNCSAVDAASAGPVFNPAIPHAKAHGATPRALGDLGLLTTDMAGVARVDVEVAGATLGGGAVNDVAGRGVVVAAVAAAQSPRLACGVLAVTRQGPAATTLLPAPPGPTLSVPAGR